MIIYLSEYTKNNKDNILHYKNTVLYTILHIYGRMSEFQFELTCHTRT